ncbi:MAG: amino acid adenylation domain-containing protein, partial [Bacteroidetes bacterium]|nr:amino acid adenylation domain-containing protein [Bacteroidota bacterium]
PVVFTSQLGLTPPFQGTREDSILGPIEYVITQTPQVWIDQQVSEREDGALVMNWDIVEDLFPDHLPADLFQAAVSLLEFLGTPSTSQGSCHWTDPVGSLIPDHQKCVRQQMNATHAPIPTGLLHEPFFAHVRIRPNAIALIDADHTTWTYRALADWSARIAHTVSTHIENGTTNQPIAVLMEKGPEQVAAVLGILAAGQTYVPLDPFWPDARITTILEKSSISIIVTQPWHAAACCDRFGSPERHIIDASEAALCHIPSDDPQGRPVDPQSPAYIIYTSGSTGVPKGVVMDHRGPLNTIIDINQRFGIEPDDRIFGLSALSFDLSVYDIFGTLAAGAALVLPREEDRRDPIQWSALCQQHGVTIWNSVPALLDMLLIEENFAAAAGLRLVMLSGDWVPLHLPERLRQYSPTTRLVCMGGATEASIWSNWFLVDRVEPEWRSIPYGFPLTNQGYRVLDEQLHDRPDWVPGDLYISGVGLALGYAEDPERTAESFIIHPVDGTRLYRTGDMARYWPDGILEFLGRCDHQVKIAGHRIETGEIEAALLAHPSVHEAVVDAVGTDGEIKKLIA